MVPSSLDIPGHQVRAGLSLVREEEICQLSVYESSKKGNCMAGITYNAQRCMHASTTSFFFHEEHFVEIYIRNYVGSGAISTYRNSSSLQNLLYHNVIQSHAHNAV